MGKFCPPEEQNEKTLCMLERTLRLYIVKRKWETSRYVLSEKTVKVSKGSFKMEFYLVAFNPAAVFSFSSL